MAGITRERLKELVKEVMTEENEYQAFFQKALDKAGKSIPSMSDEEKKAFFDKIDAAWDGRGEKNEALVGGQKELDVDGDGDIEGDDLADLRAGKKANESINEVKAGDILKHKHNPNIEIELIAPTNKGWKVYQIEKGKKKIAHFDKQDISGNKSLFESINELTVTRIHNFNLESNAYIYMLELLKNNSTFKKIASDAGMELFGGANSKNVLNTLKHSLKKVLTPQIIGSVVNKINEKGQRLSISDKDIQSGAHNERFAGLLALGLIDSFTDKPVDTQLIKDLGNAKLANAAKEFSTNRGKGTVASMMANKNESAKKPEVGDSGYVAKHKSVATIYGVMNGGKKLKVKLGKGNQTVVIDSNEIEIMDESVNEGNINEIEYKDALEKFNADLYKNSQVAAIAKHHNKPIKDVVKGLQPYIKVLRYNDKSIKLISIDFRETNSNVKVHVAQTYSQNESVNEAVVPKDMDKIKAAVQNASSFMGVGAELKKAGLKYSFSTEPLAIYIVQPTPNVKIAILNKKYASGPDFVHGDIAVGIMESKINEAEADIKVGDMVKVDNPHWEGALGKKGPFRRKVKMIDHNNVFFTDGSNSSMKYVKK